MTIAVGVQINDGVVLCADSASTIISGEGVLNVYNNANKISNLHKGLPIGLITWGLGGLNGLSVETLAKDLRRRLTGDDPEHREWAIDPASYTLSGVAERVREFFWSERYAPSAEDMKNKAREAREAAEKARADAAQLAKAVAEAQKDIESGGERLDFAELVGALEAAAQFANQTDDAADALERGLGAMGFFVAGYSSGGDRPEIYRIDVSPDWCSNPEPVHTPDSRIVWAGQPEALVRLIWGVGTDIHSVLVSDLNVAQGDVDQVIEVLTQRLFQNLVVASMPFQDAIDLAEWLVSVAIGYSRFSQGWPTVGGPIETAAISKHEGFRWVRRKHYYDPRLNPEPPARSIQP